MAHRQPERDRQILAYVEAYTREHHYPPTRRELVAAMGLKSSGAIYPRLLRLRNEGYLEWVDYRSRTMCVTKKGLKYTKE